MASLTANEITAEHWYCIYTKPNMEERVSKRLLDQPEIEVFHPRLRRRKCVRGRLQEVVEELFPCYIFSRFSPLKYYHMIKYTRGVRRVIADESGNPHIVDGEIIDQIRTRIRDGFVQLETYDFNCGDTVTVQQGPFAGLTGIFMRDLHPRDRVLILLNTIAYQASIEVEKGFFSRT
jgi:transcription elongation factor/antiterminator RfaH